MSAFNQEWIPFRKGYKGISEGAGYPDVDASSLRKKR
jgi:hypothetical protein